MFNNRFLLLFSLYIFLSSCNPLRNNLILGKWHATAIENPTLDEQLYQMDVFLDTVGNHTTPKQNEILYGVSNIDSLKLFEKNQIKQALLNQEKIIKNTLLHFKDNGIIYYTFGTPTDTACWYFEGENSLVIDEKKLKGFGNIVKIEIIKLEKNLLQLQFHDKGFSSTATFINVSE